MTDTLVESIYATITHKLPKKSNSSNEKTKAVLNQAVADLSKAASIVHQTHWYMRGPGFLYLHPQMDDYMDSLNEHLDVISERLITIGGQPYSTLKEFDEQSKLKEEKGSYDVSMSDRLTKLVEVYRYLSSLYQVGLDVTAEENDDVTNDIFVAAKTEADKTVWMLQGELGNSSELN
ncbi:DNA protection during starvation protein [Streptococcus urinalis FB127-CNA-2]|uniref:Ferritin-like protein n=1 Tax=Streptococcus urinalis 2285-97 TaxID=764291 RepID=G5KD52_9STRE|nr:Dps family protein [Streptococcus urinalis]EHJ56192.1 ferritin-like protein [Streptococcus urinalis 2285-97]EKS19316.1 DNA protection during starvation protein [Streptococcus urinalis FB127-CNA-2]VEF31447.1 peroxide resistance protein [Streptococcus urinalis]